MSIAEDQPIHYLGPGANGIAMSVADFDAIESCDERYRYELIHGVLVVNPIPSEQESDPNEELGHLLRSYQADGPQGSNLDATLPERYVYIGQDRRRADRVIWAGLGRVPDPKVDTPSIVVEFVSQGRRNWLRDYEEKRIEYLNAGVREYWVIDRFRRTMTVFLSNDQEQHEQVLSEADTYQTDLLPGFVLPLKQLFAAADRWSAE